MTKLTIKLLFFSPPVTRVVSYVLTERSGRCQRVVAAVAAAVAVSRRVHVWHAQQEPGVTASVQPNVSHVQLVSISQVQVNLLASLVLLELTESLVLTATAAAAVAVVAG